ncbi:MAG: hypothetical protein WDN49_22010 [Acetobacteraceae bacterium]
MLRGPSEPTSTPADPSLNSSTIGDAWPAPGVSRSNCAQARWLALATRPWSRTHITSEAGDGMLSPAPIRNWVRSSSKPW